MKVLHVPGVDAGTRHPTFSGALAAIRDWSLAHPRHVPVMVLVELKDTADNPLWKKRNDPVGGFDGIRSLVREGFLVRTRGDAETKEARANDPARRDKALASGAQFVRTDFPDPDPRFSRHEVNLPGGVVARANPVSAPEGAPGGELE